MRIAGAIIGLFLALIIFVQSAAAGIATALDKKAGPGGGFGFLVGFLFFVGSALMFGNVSKGAVGVWAAACVFAWIGAASSVFKDLWVWGSVALVYSSGNSVERG
jgi:hypothetical protein